MHQGHPTVPVTRDALERLLPFAAYIVVTYGPAYAPYLLRLETELEKLNRDDPVKRAHRILTAHVRLVETAASAKPLLGAATPSAPESPA